MVDDGRGDRLSTADTLAPTLCAMSSITWQRMVDGVEGAFSVEVPGGWQADVRSIRSGMTVRRVVRAVSPDGLTRLSLHDPDIPDFIEPMQGFAMPPLQQTASYVAAEVFVPQYLQQRFGRAPGLRLDPPQQELELAQATVRLGASRGINSQCSSVTQRFGFTDNGAPVDALVLGATTSFGALWVADVGILFVTGGRPDRNLLLHAMLSEQSNQQWQAGQNQLFANQRAINTQNDLAWQATMNAGHQQRMGDIAAAGAANTAIHEQRVAMGEASTAAFLNQLNQPTQTWDSGPSGSDAPALDQQHSIINSIREEETIRTSSGEDVQVEAGADRYFVDEYNRTWVGAQGNVDANDFRAAGLNPDDYHEGQIRR